MTERRKAFPAKDYQAQKEAKILGPYPAWETWKVSLYSHLKDKGFQNLDSLESAVHKWYVIRRKRQIAYQLGTLDEKEFDKVRHNFLEEHESIFGNPASAEAFKYISERTEISKEAGGRRGL